VCVREREREGERERERENACTCIPMYAYAYIHKHTHTHTKQALNPLKKSAVQDDAALEKQSAGYAAKLILIHYKCVRIQA
jgi:hypothetical protein